MLSKGTIVSVIVWLVASLLLSDNLHAAPKYTIDNTAIELQAKVRDIVNREITIANSGPGNANIFPAVRDINPQTGGWYINPDRTQAASHWISISHGQAKIKPGESVSLPVRIQIPKDAQPGTYVAAIAFGAGSTRKQAETNIAAKPHTLVTIQIGDHRKTASELGIFRPIKPFVRDGQAEFTYKVNNIGDFPVTHTGEVVFYKKDREVARLPLNSSQDTVEPGEQQAFLVAWDTGSHVGRFTAALSMQYTSDGSVITDNVEFWVIPNVLIIALIIVIGSLLLVILALNLFMR